MSPVSQLTVLAFASAALAVPGYRDFGHKHQYGHKHGHHSGSWANSAPAGTGTGAPFPYPVVNATGIYGSTGFGSGTAAPTSYASSSSESAPAGPATVTVSPVPYSYSAPASSSSVSSVENAASTTECTTDVTITTTEKTYVTVTATDESSSSVEVSATQESSSSVRTTYTITKHSTYYYTPSSSTVESSSASVSSSSSEAAPVTTSSSSSVAAYTPATSSSSAEVSPVTTSASSSSSSEAVPSTYSEANKAPAPSAYSSAAPSSYSSSATSSSASATPSSYSSGSGKRGIAYNVTDNANVMISAAGGSQVSWAYNWLSSDADIDSGVKFVPTMHAPEAPFSDWWSSDAQSAIDNGADLLFSFNEPDQSGLQPGDVANDWATYMAPFNGKAKLVAPSVTNGQSPMGLTWLGEFLKSCTDCEIDALNIHWYSPLYPTSGQDFKDQVNNAINIKGNGDTMPVYVTEFGLDSASDSDIQSFLEDVMPWMDSNPNVLGYSYFMAYDTLLLSGNSVSEPVGTTFMSYTS